MPVSTIKAPARAGVEGETQHMQFAKCAAKYCVGSMTEPSRLPLMMDIGSFDGNRLPPSLGPASRSKVGLFFFRYLSLGILTFTAASASARSA
jgi:hypothetical protein